MTKMAGRDVGTPDLLILATGVAGVVNLFLPWYRLGTDEELSDAEGRRALEFFGLPDDLRTDHLSANAFAAGLLATAAALLIVAVAALVATRLWAGLPRDRGAARPEQVGAALSGLALLLLVVKLVADHEWLAIGFFVALALAVAQVTLSLLALRGAAPRSAAEPEAGQQPEEADGGAAHDREPGQ